MQYRKAGLSVRILVACVKAYRWLISPLFPPCCRYLPTCSEYAIEALRHHGPFKGSILSLRRLLRCHPFGNGGFDPVPPPLTSDALKPAPVPDAKVGAEDRCEYRTKE
ncbi:membrane protein insertion efficiency factor YidD [Thioalkalivibrio sp. HK1]|uniref:membrane protein insertion efficiency factor YidD n=1 Tax=Thioalkalivibrio sp. HK1 TaxID=1469245 RepID=UPI001E2A75ED|nr:membrane protein insertion efficiency factor YidD [Thioalkalivibrio sp. HK1]